MKYYLFLECTNYLGRQNKKNVQIIMGHNEINLHNINSYFFFF